MISGSLPWLLRWLWFFLASSMVADARQLYRYRNADGVVVVDYQVPVEYVGKGYEVLNDEGMVIKVVPRELTEEERKANDAQQNLRMRPMLSRSACVNGMKP